jgi:cytochrome c biogenesis protein CcdA
VNVLLLLVALLADGPLLRVTPPEWDFGSISAQAGIRTIEARIENRTDRPVAVSLTSTCDCLSVEPTSLAIPPGGGASFRLRYDPATEYGEVEKYLIVASDLPELPKALYLVRGTVAGAAKPGRQPDTEVGTDAGAKPAIRGAQAGRQPDTEVGTDAGTEVPLDFYYAAGCRSCLRFLRRTVPQLERELGLRLPVREHDILDPGVYEAYQALLRSRGEQEKAFPALLAGEQLLQGEPAIRGGIRPALKDARAGGAGEQASAPASLAGILPGKLALLPILAAGLLDGINPCAFTTLVFLLSALALAGRSRRQILLIGACFTAAVFLTYLAIGAGLLQGVRLAGAFPVVSAALRWLLIAGLTVLAALSLYDYFLIRCGRSKDILLQLPDRFKQRIHRDIRKRTRAAGLAASSLVLGFLIAVFELACTGQVYFPTLVYLVRVRPDAGSFFYLLLYNLGFILPLGVIFLLAYFGVASQRLAGFARRSLAGVKLALAALFLGLAVLTYFT